MLKKVINVGGKEVAFRSSATVPRLYRAKFKRDIFKDLDGLVHHGMKCGLELKISS